jgi:hypothetical protein
MVVNPTHPRDDAGIRCKSPTSILSSWPVLGSTTDRQRLAGQVLDELQIWTIKE